MNSLAINTTLNDRISAFAKAGSLLSSYLKKEPTTATATIEPLFIELRPKIHGLPMKILIMHLNNGL
ncbi:hypothetical protein JCM19298_482 [Nonlabens ulvanivorans]|nr:hypothetical protein [Nonlabens ulvanivorans]GAK94007.1 hypothetical protein JCM19298_482 [Nonlabens ulvanivorans]